VKIIQATETYGPGGAEQVIIRLCSALRSAGHEVEVIMMRPGWLAEQLAADGVRVHLLPLGNPLGHRFVASLAALVRECRADVLHTHEFSFAFYGRLAARATGLPLVATAHGANFARGWKRRLVGATALRPVSGFRLAAVSDSLAGHLERAFWIRRDGVDVVRNGIDVCEWEDRAATDRGVPFRLVAVGNLYPVKNHAGLVRVVAALRARGVPAELDVLGRGAEEDHLRTVIREHELDGLVRLQGFQADVSRFLRASDVFVSASVSEQMPLSFLEAMAQGLPIVASRVGGVPEVVEDGHNGLLFELGDQERAVTCLEGLWQDGNRRRALGRNGRARVEASYGTRSMAEAYLGLYGKALQGTRSGREGRQNAR
jgi:glycosyltransferase involved in cell wall biosynthesis